MDIEQALERRLTVKLLTKSRFKGVHVDSCGKPDVSYPTFAEDVIHVTPRDEAIIADVFYHTLKKEFWVRATYNIPPLQPPFVFYSGKDIDKAQEAFDEVFNTKKEDHDHKPLNWDVFGKRGASYLG